MRRAAGRPARRGSPALRIAILVEDQSVVIRVEDHGVGMTPRETSKMFEPFVGASDEPSHGLGLAMVKKGVMAMGGQVSCESAIGVGTTITLVLART